MRLAELLGKNVALWGYGKEGAAVVTALRQLDEKARIALINDTIPESAGAAVFSELITGSSIAARLCGFEVIVKSPGVSLYRPELQAALRNGAELLSATELALAELDLEHVIGVTGTKGKSTTAALINHLLRGSGASSLIAGNIGAPLLSVLDEARKSEYVVLELSSYQIADLSRFPKTAVLTNLYSDHLTWHGSLERYHSDKLRLFSNSDTVGIFNREDPASREYVSTRRGENLWYNDPQGIHVQDGAFYHGSTRLFSTGAVRLLGLHNLSNVCAALSVMNTIGADLRDCERPLATFEGLPHRLMLLGEKDGVLYVDDSISTVPETSLAGLQCFLPRPVTLILGGVDRGQDWTSFARKLRKLQAEAVITLPANGDTIASALQTEGVEVPIVQTGDLAEAVAAAKNLTPPGGVVLLSPGSASFSQFRNFEERGEIFARLCGFSPAEKGAA